MKYLLTIFIAIFSFVQINAQTIALKKTPTIGLHYFYNDFITPQQIKTNGLGNVLQHGLWNSPNKMQGGFGIDYLNGIHKNIDLIATVNGNWVDYIQPSGVAYGSSNFMLDLNAGAHIKMFNDKHVFNPFLIAKAGYLSYKNINGLNAQPGFGFQINLFNEAYLLTTAKYRVPLSNTLSTQVYYSLGISTAIFNKKTKIPELDTDGDGIIDKKDKCTDVPGKAKYNGCPIPDKDGDGVNDELDKCPDVLGAADNNGCPKKVKARNIIVRVTDEATKLPLPYVSVFVNGPNGNNLTGMTDADGKANFNTVNVADYTVSGILNGINTSKQNLSNIDFETSNSSIEVKLTHNDPRFTLIGNVVNKTTNEPEANVEVNINNETRGIITTKESEAGDGLFRTQLEAKSIISVVAKKANYLSNIERLSTIGLNRSTTLYVKLELGIQDASAGKSIVLNAIYFETGKSSINTKTSSDLEKLVQFLNDNLSTILEIQGYTDNTGSLAMNNKLSQNRANSIVNYLGSKGISKTRLLAKGYGPLSPIATNATTEGKAKNRRVEMKVY